MPYTVILKKTEEKRIVAGHAWVYANEVQRIEGKDKNGSLATVLSADGKFIGKGYINHASKILRRVGKPKKARIRKLLPRGVCRSGRPPRAHRG